MENIPDEQVNDDKTVAVLINTSVRTKKQPKEYYQEPDWASLKKKHDDEWKRAAYPGLFKDDGVQNQYESAANQTPPEPSDMNNTELLKSEQSTLAEPAPRKFRKLYFAIAGVMIICFTAVIAAAILFLR